MQTYADVTRKAEGGDTEAQELLAQVFEQAGRPVDAAAWMARAASGGRSSALGQLGLWRLVGFGLPAQPAAAVAEILRAAEAGDPFALELVGVVLAGGIGTPRDLPAALRWLVRASRAGIGRATCQLSLLVGDGDPALAAALMGLAQAQGFEPVARLSRPVSRGVVDYDRALQAIDLSAFSAPLTREPVREAPAIAVLPDLLPAWACDYVIALAGPVLTRGKVVDPAGGESVSGERTNTVMSFGLADSDVLLELINNRIALAAGLPPENAEGLGVLHYAPGEQYHPHVDYIPDTDANAAQLAHRGQRVRTLLVYLNEGFEGGATEFLRLDLALKPPRGCGLVFDNVRADGQAEPLSLHRGAPPTRGQKWLISKWFRTKALRPGPGAG